MSLGTAYGCYQRVLRWLQSSSQRGRKRAYYNRWRKPRASIMRQIFVMLVRAACAGNAGNR
jgi:hypothetical protein